MHKLLVRKARQECLFATLAAWHIILYITTSGDHHFGISLVCQSKMRGSPLKVLVVVICSLLPCFQAAPDQSNLKDCNGIAIHANPAVKGKDTPKRIFEDFFDFKMRIYPVQAGTFGFHQYDGLMGLSSKACLLRVAAICGAFEQRVKKLLRGREIR